MRSLRPRASCAASAASLPLAGPALGRGLPLAGPGGRRADASRSRASTAASRPGAASGAEVVVTATKRGRPSDPDLVEDREWSSTTGGVTICAVYPARRSDKPNECRPGDGGGMQLERQRREVDFEVQVPKGVHFVGRTVNGGIEAEDLPDDAVAYTVNGGVQVTAGGDRPRRDRERLHPRLHGPGRLAGRPSASRP